MASSIRVVFLTDSDSESESDAPVWDQTQISMAHTDYFTDEEQNYVLEGGLDAPCVICRNPYNREAILKAQTNLTMALCSRLYRLYRSEMVCLNGEVSSTPDFDFSTECLPFCLTCRRDLLEAAKLCVKMELIEEQLETVISRLRERAINSWTTTEYWSDRDAKVGALRQTMLKSISEETVRNLRLRGTEIERVMEPNPVRTLREPDALNELAPPASDNENSNETSELQVDEILWNGKRLPRSAITVIFQNPEDQIVEFTVQDNVSEADEEQMIFPNNFFQVMGATSMEEGGSEVLPSPSKTIPVPESTHELQEMHTKETGKSYHISSGSNYPNMIVKREFICTACRKSFANHEDLVRHERHYINTEVSSFTDISTYSNPSTSTVRVRRTHQSLQTNNGFSRILETSFVNFEPGNEEIIPPEDAEINRDSNRRISPSVSGPRKRDVRRVSFVNLTGHSQPDQKSNEKRILRPRLAKHDCDDCGEMFTSEIQLRAHERMHQKMECFICPKRFHRLNDFKSHMQHHNNRLKECKFFRCRLCNKESDFTYAYSLQNHFTKIHNAGADWVARKRRQENEEYIPIPRQSEVRNQKRRRTGEFPCNYCEKAFSSASNRSRHFKNVHAILPV